MSYCNWRHILVFAVAIVAAPLAAQQSSNRGGDQASANQSAESTDNSPSVATAINRLTDEMAKAHREQADPYGDERNERERRDIFAQEDMAFWAKAMFWTVGVQTLLALGALVALIVDLRQSRRSAELQLRAYVSVQPRELHLQGQSGEVWAEIELTNGGATPAFNLRHGGNFFIGTEEEAEKAVQRARQIPEIGRARPFTLQIGQSTKADIHRDRDMTAQEFQSVSTGEKSIFAFGFVAYEDAFSKTHTTEFCYECEAIRPPTATEMKRGGPVRHEMAWFTAPFHNGST